MLPAFSQLDGIGLSVRIQDGIPGVRNEKSGSLELRKAGVRHIAKAKRREAGGAARRAVGVGVRGYH